jgi:hypothetical protein
MTSVFESERSKKVMRPFEGIAHQLNKSIFPGLAWDLKQSGSTISAVRYLETVLYLTVAVFLVLLGAILIPSFLVGKLETGIKLAVMILPVATGLFFLFFILSPKLKTSRFQRKNN